MSKLARRLLAKWVVQVMYMMCHNYSAYSGEDRYELATITAELEAELKGK